MTISESKKPPRRGRRRSAFTLIEVMAVVGILALLMAFTVIGLRHLNRTAKDNDTHSVLQSAQAMIDELGAGGGTSKLAAVVAGYYPKVGTINTAAVAPGGVAEGQSARDPSTNPNGAVAATQAILAALLTNPKNKEMFDGLPKQRKLYLPVAGNPTQTQAPLLVDGYGNPIIFVPSGGLKGVGVAGQPASSAALQSTPPRSFWASAGEDGDFTKGDDNIYSFSK